MDENAAGPTSTYRVLSVMSAFVAPRVIPLSSTTTTVESEFDSLFRTHYPTIVRHARALGVEDGAAEDVAQEVFVIAHRKIPDLEGPATRTWLFAIARRVCANHRRKVSRAKAKNDEAPAPVAGPDPEQFTERRKAAQVLLGFLDGLPDEQREVFVLFDIEKLRAKQVAEVVGIPVNTVYSRLNRARGKLQRVLSRARSKEESIRVAR